MGWIRSVWSTYLLYMKGFIGSIIVILALWGIGYSWLWAFAVMYKLAFYFHFLP